ncbi:hypothetical protein PoB_004959700 [Plakobranchus ocellatus]|uniref:Uncharacterized protein n=1 Tax=Plakobranchus ocellatus TaxID=259542 RepID=A0AAV4BUP1_9GAST|nr:hypothetical protein PoB_004959700 [Plakobranchus ocellatus]
MEGLRFKPIPQDPDDRERRSDYKPRGATTRKYSNDSLPPSSISSSSNKNNNNNKNNNSINNSNSPSYRRNSRSSFDSNSSNEGSYSNRNVDREDRVRHNHHHHHKNGVSYRNSTDYSTDENGESINGGHRSLLNRRSSSAMRVRELRDVLTSMTSSQEEEEGQEMKGSQKARLLVASQQRLMSRLQDLSHQLDSMDSEVTRVKGDIMNSRSHLRHFVSDFLKQSRLLVLTFNIDILMFRSKLDVFAFFIGLCVVDTYLQLYSLYLISNYIIYCLDCSTSRYTSYQTISFAASIALHLATPHIKLYHLQPRLLYISLHLISNYIIYCLDCSTSRDTSYQTISITASIALHLPTPHIKLYHLLPGLLYISLHLISNYIIYCLDCSTSRYTSYQAISFTAWIALHLSTLISNYIIYCLDCSTSLYTHIKLYHLLSGLLYISLHLISNYINYCLDCSTSRYTSYQTLSITASIALHLATPHIKLYKLLPRLLYISLHLISNSINYCLDCSTSRYTSYQTISFTAWIALYLGTQFPISITRKSLTCTAVTN